MADTLAPKVGANLSLESPVAAPRVGSALSFLGDLAGNIFQSAQPTAPTKAEVDDQLEAVRIRSLQEGLGEASQLRAQGYTSDADRMERQVILNYRVDGGDTTGQAYTDIIRLTTGRDVEMAGMSAEDIAMNEAMQSPAFHKGLLASYYALPSDASTEDRQNFALSRIGQEDYYAGLITTSSLDWDAGKKDAFLGIINNFRQTQIGSLNAIVENGGAISLPDFQAARNEWNGQVALLNQLRPDQLPDNKWSEIQTEITFTNSLFDKLESMVGAEGVNAQLTSNIAMAVQQLWQTEKIDALQASALMKMSDADFISLVESGQIEGFGNWQELVGLLSATTMTSRPVGEQGTRANPNAIPNANDPDPNSPFDPRILESVSGGDAQKYFDDALKLTKITGSLSLEGSSFNRTLTTDLLEKAFASTYLMASGEGRFLGAGDVDNIFNGSVLSTIERLGTTDPMKAREILLTGAEALRAQHTIASEVLLNMSDGLFDKETQTLNVTPETLVNQGLDINIATDLAGAADRYYGGDFKAMVDDRGRRFSFEDTALKNIIGGGIIQGMKAQMKRLEDQGALVKHLEQLYTTFDSRAESYTSDEGTITGGGGDTEIEGSAGEDELVPDLRAAAADAARRHGIPEGIFMNLVQQESSWRTDAKSGVGALGLTQLMPGTAADLGVDPNDPMQNLEGGARYLAQQFEKFGSWDLALAAYNAGPTRVARAGGIPDIEETQNYVKTILGGNTYERVPTPTNIVFNPAMNPIVDMDGASRMVHEYAPDRLNWVLTNPFQEMQRLFGAPLTINDALAKEGTTRERETPGSRHFHGDALDISLAGMSEEEKLRVFQSALAAGFQGFGFGNDILHVDMGATRSWNYGIDSFGGMSMADLQNAIASGVLPRPDLASAAGTAAPGTSAGGGEAIAEFDPEEGKPRGLVSITSEAPRESPRPEPRPSPVGDTQQKPAASEKATQELTERTNTMLKSLGIDSTSVKKFRSEEEYREAVKTGKVKAGDFVAIGQEVFQHN